jgi:hypothetical protein
MFMVGGKEVVSGSQSFISSGWSYARGLGPVISKNQSEFAVEGC